MFFRDLEMKPNKNLIEMVKNNVAFMKSSNNLNEIATKLSKYGYTVEPLNQASPHLFMVRMLENGESSIYCLDVQAGEIIVHKNINSGLSKDKQHQLLTKIGLPQYVTGELTVAMNTHNFHPKW